MPFLIFPKTKAMNASIDEIPSILEKEGYKRPFVLIYKKEVASNMLKIMENKGLSATIIEKIPPNPSIDLVEDLKKKYLESNSDSIVSIGGGSSMDAAKALGALIANPKKDIPHLRGLLKVHKRYPMLILSPTTAGTGSEITIASVISNHETGEKFAINDPHLLPQYAILDDGLLASLPKSLISSTGMDALTHAVEAYIGSALTKETKKDAEEAIKLIHENLLDFYNDPSNKEARVNMLWASHLAGKAFTRSYVGYVHAVAHSLGGQYDLAHGYCNAILLPMLLKAYGKKAYGKLSKLAKMLKISTGDNKKENALAFIGWIEEMNSKMDLNKDLIKNTLKEEDIPLLARRASKEGNPLYPVPKEMNAKELEEIYKELLS